MGYQHIAGIVTQDILELNVRKITKVGRRVDLMVIHN